MGSSSWEPWRVQIPLYWEQKPKRQHQKQKQGQSADWSHKCRIEIKLSQAKINSLLQSPWLRCVLRHMWGDNSPCSGSLLSPRPSSLLCFTSAALFSSDNNWKQIASWRRPNWDDMAHQHLGWTTTALWSEWEYGFSTNERKSFLIPPPYCLFWEGHVCVVVCSPVPDKSLRKQMVEFFGKHKNFPEKNNKRAGIGGGITRVCLRCRQLFTVQLNISWVVVFSSDRDGAVLRKVQEAKRKERRSSSGIGSGEQVGSLNAPNRRR